MSVPVVEGIGTWGQRAKQGLTSRLRSLAARAYVRLDFRARLTVVTLHRVGSGYPVTPDHVRHHFAFLAAHYAIVTPTTLPSSWNDRRAMITIDDCHRDIYTHIFPVARDLGVPFTICVPTDFFLRNQWLWFDHLYWMLERARTGTAIFVEGSAFQVGDEASIARLKVLLKRKLPAERNALLASISEQLGCHPPASPCDGYEAVTPAQMREMLDSGLVELCAHTATHTIATVLPDDMLRPELRESKRELEAFCGREVASFCYPNGARGDFDERTTQAIRDEGYTLAFTSIEGTNRAVGFDPYRLRRVHAHRMPSVFEKEASGIGDLLRRLRHTF